MSCLLFPLCKCLRQAGHIFLDITLCPLPSTRALHQVSGINPPPARVVLTPRSAESCLKHGVNPEILRVRDLDRCALLCCVLRRARLERRPPLPLVTIQDSGNWRSIYRWKRLHPPKAINPSNYRSWPNGKDFGIFHQEKMREHEVYAFPFGRMTMSATFARCSCGMSVPFVQMLCLSPLVSWRGVM